MSTAKETQPGIGLTLGWWFVGGLLRPIVSYLGAIVIAAGPWLVAVVALAFVSVTMTPLLGYNAVEDLRLTVVYAFCIAPLVAGPIGAILSRVIAAEVEAGALRQAPELFLVAAIGSALVAETLALALVLVLGIAPFEVGAAFVFLTGAAALLWTSFAALTALKAFRLLIGSFTGGMCVAVLCIVLAKRDLDTETLIWSFTAGIALSVAFAVIRVRTTAATREVDAARALRSLLVEVRRFWLLGFAVLFAFAAAWMDKWVAWFGPEATRSSAGFLHFSAYDGVMFVAHLAAIPSYAALLVLHDTDLRRAAEGFRATLSDRSSLARIRGAVRTLEKTVWSGIFSIVFLQAALTACMVLMAPAIAKQMEFSFDQFLMLRVGLIGVFLHTVFYLCCAVLLVCNRVRVFLILQAAFLIMNLVASIGFYATFGVSAYGFFVSALVMAVAAFVAAYRAVLKFDYLTFVGENDALYSR